jgi:type II secretory pathway component GspD/PulD (secretin)
MLSFITKLVTPLVVTLIVIPAVLAQQPNTTQEKPKDDFVTERQFKSKIFEVKYREPSSIANVLRQLGSGFKGASISANNEFKTLTVRDFPENLATIEEAIKRLDTPAPPRASVQMHMHVLLASNRSDTTPAAEIPLELKDVITELRGTLTYRKYELITSVLQRLTETNRGLNGSGLAQIPGSQSGATTTTAPYEYYVNQLSFVPNASGTQAIQIQDFTFVMTGDGIRGRVQTALNLRDGEKVVVGTATINDRALIVVLIPKIVR